MHVYVDDASNLDMIDWTEYNPIVLLNIVPSPSASSLLLHSAVSYGTYFSTVDACVSYVDRIIKASLGVDWLILLEDDAWVCNRINTSALVYDMNGQCLAQYNREIWGEMVPGSCYGGYGGFVLRASFLQRAMRVDHEYIGSILVHIKRPIASDELLSALFLRSNGTIGVIEDYAEQMAPASSPVIVHQMKHFY